MGKQDEPKISFQLFPTPEELIAQKSCSFLNKTGKLCSSNSSSSESTTTSFDSNSSITSLSSSDLMEDTTSSTSSSSSSSSNGPLYHLSDLMDKLPIKRGLSKYYTGKSESFTSLASVENLEDLAKRENPYRKRMKLFSRKVCSPKATISKKASYSRNHFSRNCGSTLMARPPPDVLPVLKDF